LIGKVRDPAVSLDLVDRENRGGLFGSSHDGELLQVLKFFGGPLGEDIFIALLSGFRKITDEEFCDILGTARKNPLPEQIERCD
jgi:hypothetical protein